MIVDWRVISLYHGNRVSEEKDLHRSYQYLFLADNFRFHLPLTD